jgi:Gas vesicle protein G
MLFKLLGLPLTLPVSGMKFIFQQVADLADHELYDPSVVHEQLMLLQVQLEDGDIDEDEYVEREAELLARLREIKQRQQERRSADAQDVPVEANVDAQRRVIVETPFDEQ